MGDTTASTASPTDGRRARRERGRTAVIDAVFELAEEGKVPVTAELDRGALRGVGRVDLPVLRRPQRSPAADVPPHSANGSHRWCTRSDKGPRADRIAATRRLAARSVRAGGSDDGARSSPSPRTRPAARSVEPKPRQRSPIRSERPRVPRRRASSPGRVAELVAVVDAFDVGRSVGRDAQDPCSIAGADRHDLAARHRPY